MKQALYLIFIFKVGFGSAQSLDQTVSFADNLYENQAFESAVEAYKRVLFFDTSGLYNNVIFPKIADCSYITKKYEEAASYYELSYFTTENDTLRNNYLLKKVSCYLIMQQYDYAQIELFNLTDNINDDQKRESNQLEAIMLFAKNDFEESEKKFKSLSKDSTIVDNLFRKNEKVSKISPRKARIMSIILPGLGQIYVGDYKNGINSFLLTAGLFTLGVRSALVNGPLDAIISTIPWFQRYYQGGFNKAEIIAKAKIQEKRYKIYNELLDQIE